MNFYLFTCIEQYPIGENKAFKDTLKAFFNAPHIKPYYDAMMRSGTDDERLACQKTCKRFLSVFQSFLDDRPDYDADRHVDFLRQLMSLTTEEAEAKRQELDENFLQMHLPLLFQNYFDAIEDAIKTHGHSAIKREHEKVLSSSTDFFLSFNDYLRAAYSGTISNNDSTQTTVPEWLYYLRYVAHIVTPYTQLPLNSENKRQAINFLEELNKVEGKIEKLNELILEGSGYYKQIESLQNLKRLSYIKLLSLIGNAPDHLSNQAEVHALMEKQKQQILYELCTFTRLKKIASDGLRTFSQRYYMDGKLDSSCEIVAPCIPFLDYWENNLPKIAKRQNDINTLERLASESKKCNKQNCLYRYVSEAEYEEIKRMTAFNQAPNASFEREKWFFFEGGTPGNHVTHPFYCAIYLKNGTLATLHDLQKDDHTYSTVVKKEAEPNCVGLHEDALPFLNALVVKVDIYDTKTRKLVDSVAFPQVKNNKPMTDELPPQPIVNGYRQYIDLVRDMQDLTIPDKNPKNRIR